MSVLSLITSIVKLYAFLQQNLCQGNVLSSLCFALEVNFTMQFAVKQEVASCRGVQIPESRKFLLVESWILGFEIRTTAQGIRGIPLTIEIRNPNFNEKVRNPLPEIRNPLRRIQNPRLSWIPLYGAKEVITG